MATSVNQYHVATYSFSKTAFKDGYKIEKGLRLAVDMSTASQAVGALTVQTIDHEQVRENALTSFDTALLMSAREHR